MDNRPIYKTAEELGIQRWEHDGLAAPAGVALSALLGLAAVATMEVDRRRWRRRSERVTVASLMALRRTDA